MGAKRPGSRGETTRLNFRGETTRGETTRGEMVWGRNVLLPAVRNHCRTHPAPCVRPRCVCSVLRAHVQFCLFDKADATADDTAITDRHSDTTNVQLRAHWVRISWSIGSEKSFGHVPLVGVEPSTPCMQGEHSVH